MPHGGLMLPACPCSIRPPVLRLGSCGLEGAWRQWAEFSLPHGGVAGGWGEWPGPAGFAAEAADRYQPPGGAWRRWAGISAAAPQPVGRTARPFPWPRWARGRIGADSPRPAAACAVSSPVLSWGRDRDRYRDQRAGCRTRPAPGCLVCPATARGRPGAAHPRGQRWFPSAAGVAGSTGRWRWRCCSGTSLAGSSRAATGRRCLDGTAGSERAGPGCGAGAPTAGGGACRKGGACRTGSACGPHGDGPGPAACPGVRWRWPQPIARPQARWAPRSPRRCA